MGLPEAWSNRFDQGLNPGIEKFNASIGFDITLLQEDLDGSIAHARMLGDCGVITLQEASELEAGLETIRGEAASGVFQPALADEDVHFAVERRLIALLGPLGKKLHTGRSRNDQVGCDLRLWLRRRIIDLDGEISLNFGVFGLPETFLTDNQGNIIFKHSGPLTEEVIQKEILPNL